MENRPIFQVGMAGFEKYGTDGYSQIGVYRELVSIIRKLPHQDPAKLKRIMQVQILVLGCFFALDFCFDS